MIDQKNAAAYRAQLDELDAYVRKVISTIPARQRQLVTAHDAFGYFSRAYDIPVHSVQGITTESEAGLADITTAGVLGHRNKSDRQRQ